MTEHRPYALQLGSQFWAYWPGMKRPVHIVSENQRILAPLKGGMQPGGYATEFQGRAVGRTAVHADAGEGGVRMLVTVTC